MALFIRIGGNPDFFSSNSADKESIKQTLHMPVGETNRTESIFSITTAENVVKSSS